MYIYTILCFYDDIDFAEMARRVVKYSSFVILYTCLIAEKFG